jgi:opacity protein-like surface antigen
MKRAFILVFSLLSLAGSSAARIRFEAGFFFGARTVHDSDIKSVYGNGTAYYPYIAAEVRRGLMVGAGYEGGYARDGRIGLYREPTTLTVTGIEAFVGYAFRTGIASPYLKAGLGSYSYRQTIDSVYLQEFRVDHKKGTWSLAGGLKLFPIERAFLALEVKYVPLKVRPFEDEVDLGGWRCQGGIGFRF